MPGKRKVNIPHKGIENRRRQSPEPRIEILPPPQPNAEVALSHELFLFRNKRLEVALKHSIDYDESFHNAYFNWYEGLYLICDGCILDVLKKMHILDECMMFMDDFFAMQEREGEVESHRKVYTLLMMVSEIVTQLINQTRDLKGNFPETEMVNFHKVCDYIVFEYSKKMELECPNHIRLRILVGTSVEEVEYPN